MLLLPNYALTMEEHDNVGWNTVSNKSRKMSKLYKQDGTRLTQNEVKLTKELQKQYLLEKKNKGKKKQKEIGVQMVRNQTNIYGNGDMENPLDHGYRLLTKEDTTLTPEETAKVEEAGHKLFCCLCCDNTKLISDIIGRQVYSCGTCYCCIGDDPYGDICTVYVNDETRSLYMTASKEKLEELAEFNKKYNETHTQIN